MTKTRLLGPSLAVLAALSFALSVPLGKRLLGSVEPLLLAGLLYFGAGLALTAYRTVVAHWQGGRPVGLSSQVSGTVGDGAGSAADIRWLAAAVLTGGVAAPVLLLWGLRDTPAATASLLLSFEVVLTALWAAGLFREHIGPQVWGAVAAVTLGTVFLGFEEGGGWRLSAGALGVILACALWGLDNNLTRSIANLEATRVAQVKGLAAGTVNLSAAALLGASLPSFSTLGAALLLGGVSYGASLVLFVHALRHLGSARTAAYFGAAPFFAAGLSLALAGSVPTPLFGLAAVAMAVGAVLMVFEQHEHEHTHGDVTHTHWHAPDREHRHRH